MRSVVCLIRTAVLLVAMLLGVGACGCQSTQTPLPQPAQKTVTQTILHENATGPIIICFPGTQPLSEASSYYGLWQAVSKVTEQAASSVGFFGYHAEQEACTWAQAQDNGFGERPIIVLGYGYGGSAACEFVRLWTTPRRETHRRAQPISLLITVDALKKGRFGFATGTTLGIMTLDKGIPYISSSSLAYTDAPIPNKETLLRHVNYYQEASALLHGTSLPYATENHCIVRDTPRLVTHARIDNIVVPFIMADLAPFFPSRGNQP